MSEEIKKRAAEIREARTKKVVSSRTHAIRLPEEISDLITIHADKNLLSFNAEVVRRLKQSFD